MYYPENVAAWNRILILFLLHVALTVLWVIDKIYSMQYLYILYFLSGCFPVLAFFLVMQDQKLLHRLKPGNDQKKYRKSRIKNIDIETALFELDDFMRSQRVYCNSGISLTNLTAELDYTPHQLSELLSMQIDY